LHNSLTLTAIVLSFLITACGERHIARLPAQPTAPTVFTLCDLSQNDPNQPIAGCWVGTFDANEPTDPMSDCAHHTAATATFKHVGATVLGTLWARDACGLANATFEGTLTDVTLDGTLTTTLATTYRGTVSGTLSGDGLELSISVMRSGKDTINEPGMMHLHR